MAGATLLAWGGPGPAASVGGTIHGADPGSDVAVLVTRNDCADPDRRPVVLGRSTRLGPGPFVVDVPEAGPGIGWVCALELRPGSRSASRWVQARVPRGLRSGPDGRLAVPAFELHLAPGPPLPHPDLAASRPPHAGEDVSGAGALIGGPSGGSDGGGPPGGTP